MFIYKIDKDTAGRFGDGAGYADFEYIMASIHNHFINKSIAYSNSPPLGQAPQSSTPPLSPINYIRFFITSNNKQIKQKFAK